MQRGVLLAERAVRAVPDGVPEMYLEHFLLLVPVSVVCLFGRAVRLQQQQQLFCQRHGLRPLRGDQLLGLFLPHYLSLLRVRVLPEFLHRMLAPGLRRWGYSRDGAVRRREPHRRGRVQQRLRSGDAVEVRERYRGGSQQLLLRYQQFRRGDGGADLLLQPAQSGVQVHRQLERGEVQLQRVSHRQHHCLADRLLPFRLPPDLHLYHNAKHPERPRAILLQPCRPDLHPQRLQLLPRQHQHRNQPHQ